MSEEYPLPSLIPEHTRTNTPQQWAIRTPESITTIGHRSTRHPPPISGNMGGSGGPHDYPEILGFEAVLGPPQGCAMAGAGGMCR
jgi:hypothetical protein